MSETIQKGFLDNTIVVKVGTSIVTRENNEDALGLPSLDLNLFQDLANGISAVMEATGRRVILVSSGAVAAGRQILRRTRADSQGTAAKQSLASMGQPELMTEYRNAFGRAIPSRLVSQMLLTADNFTRDDERNNMLAMLDELSDRAVPVVNENDTVATKELTLGDNDQLAAKIARLVRANLLVLFTDTEGVFNENPKDNPDARLIHELPVEMITEDFIRACGAGKSTNGTGGMASKLDAARIAALAGIPTTIAYGKRPSNLSAIVRGEKVGTRILPN